MFSGSKCFNRPCKPQIIDKNLMKIIFDKKIHLHTQDTQQMRGETQRYL